MVYLLETFSLYYIRSTAKIQYLAVSHTGVCVIFFSEQTKSDLLKSCRKHDRGSEIDMSGTTGCTQTRHQPLESSKKDK